MAIKAFENKNYNLALEQYRAAIANLESKKVRKLKDNKNLITALSGAAVCNAINAFHNSSDRAIAHLQGIEQEILLHLAKAQEIYNSLKRNKEIQKEIDSQRDDAYAYLRDTFWNCGDDLIATAMKENSELDFEGRKQIYKDIETCMMTYLRLTQSMEHLNILVQNSNCSSARSSLAELYDWYSDLYLYRADAKKILEPENSRAALEKAVEYNVKAVSMWLKIDTKKDITMLHLGHLNIMHQMFEQSHDQNCLDSLLEYMNKYLNDELSSLNTKIEVTGMRLFVAINKTPQDSALIHHLAVQLLTYTPPLDQSQLNYYFDLAKQFAEVEHKVVPLNQGVTEVSNKISPLEAVAANGHSLNCQPSPAHAPTKPKGKRVSGTDLTAKSAREGYDPSLFALTPSNRNKKRKSQEAADNPLMLLSSIALQ
jgi:hypothetical protein